MTVTAKTGRNGKELKRVLSWQLNRDVVDAEIAAALGRPPATYSRRKDAADFPTFEELDLVGQAFGINPRFLQVEFEYLDPEELTSLDKLIQDPTMKYTRKRGRPRKEKIGLPASLTEAWPIAR